MKQKLRERIRAFWQEDNGIGVVEIILILVVLIGLVLIFQTQIEGIVTSAFQKITGDAGVLLD